MSSIKFENYNTPEFKVVKEIFSDYAHMELYLAHIVEEYLYTTVRGYWDNGQLKIEYRMKEEREDGEYKSWDKNAQLMSQCYYKEGNFEGEYKTWFRNGQLCVQCYYKEGKIEGEYKKWYENGQLWLQKYYKEGELIR